jgi:hypothetical protein
VRGRLLRGSRVAAGPPVDGHHLHRLVPGTGNGASVPGRARNRMPGSAATAQYRTCHPRATAGTRAGLGGSAPIHTLGHGRTPAVIRLCLRKSERVPSAARPQTCGDEGPRRPPTAGTTHRSQTSVPVRGEYPSRPSPCGRLGWPVTPGTGRIPPKGPKRAQHYRRQRVAYTGRKLLSGYGRCQKRCHPQLPGIYCQDV